MTRALPLFAAVLSALVALVSLRILVLPVDVQMPHMAHYLPEVPLAAMAHLVLGPLALLLVPLQLWPRLRQARPRLHRVTGRIAGLSMVGSGIAALAMLPHFLGSAFAAMGFAVLAVLWIAIPIAGILRARTGNLAGHRRMMLRAAALTFSAVTLRLYMAPLIASGWTVVETYQITAWACWIPNLIVAEWLIRRGVNRPALPV